MAILGITPASSAQRSSQVMGYVKVRAVWRQALLFVVAALLVAGAGYVWDRRAKPAEPPPARPEQLRAAFGPADYPAALAAVESRIAGARSHLAQSPGEWLRMEALASALISRFRLTGDLADIAEADLLLGKALALAPAPAGPMLARTNVSLMLHRLGVAEAALDRFDRQVVPPPDNERADALAMRGDIAFQRGDMARAGEFYGKALALSGTPGMKIRSAVLLARSGRLDEARRATDAALVMPGQQPATLAELALQRASLSYATGDWDEAARWIDAAARIFPGGWQAQAWSAQQRAIGGDLNGAVAEYTGLAERTRRPEVMDALAYLLRLQGRGAESRIWAERAAALWAERMARFPQAFAQHAAEHELALGSPQAALVLARIDAAARPYGQSLVPLARAQTLSGDPAGALKTIEQAEATGWTTGLLQLEKAAALDALGRGEEAASARQKALAQNPLISDQAALLVWFGHE